METVKKLIPFESSDIPAVQSWLEELAREGLFYKECGMMCAVFEKNEPKMMRYRLDFCDVVAGRIPEEKQELYEKAGWQVAGEFKNDLVVVSCDDPEAPEIFTENSGIVKPLKKLLKKHNVYTVMFALLFIFTEGWPIASVFSHGRSFAAMMSDFTAWRFVLVSVLLVLLLAEFILHLCSTKHLKRLIRNIEKGMSLPMGEPYKKKKFFGSVLVPLSLPIIVLWFLLLVNPAGMISYKETLDISDLPFPTVAQINAEEYEYFAEGMKKVGVNSLGSVSQKHDFITPRQIRFMQDTSTFEIVFGKSELDFLYDVLYFEFRSADTAHEKAAELLSGYKDFDAEEYHRMMKKIIEDYEKNGVEYETDYDGFTPTYDITDLSTDGAEVKYVFEKYAHPDFAVRQHLIICSGNRVLRANYDGESDLRDFIGMYIDYMNK